MSLLRRPASLSALVLAAVLAAAAPAVSAAPAPDARAYILVNPGSGETLAALRPGVALPMASTTKMMTALVVVETVSLDETVTVPASAVRAGESTAYLVPGERISVRNLLVGLLIGSGNDAALALADHVSGSERAFVARMNERARELGLTATRFANPHGLDAPGHRSSVRDLVTLAESFMAVPELRAIVARRRATIPGPGGSGTRFLESKNDLLDIYRDADGVKTGNTDGAGYAMVAHARRPRLGVELYAAVIGAPSEQERALDMRRLLEWGFRQYGNAALLRPGALYARLPVRGAGGARVDLRASGPALVAAIRINRPVTEAIVAPAEVMPPVRRGQVLGQVVVRQGDAVLGVRPLVAGADVAEPGLWQRVRNGIGGILP